jgi:hypothetical protein
MANQARGDDATNSQEKGRGWHGNSEGHKRAGRLGGLARSRRNKEQESDDNSQNR